MVSGFDPLGPRDVVFVPVALNYDRVLEDRMLTSAASTEPGKGRYLVSTHSSSISTS